MLEHKRLSEFKIYFFDSFVVILSISILQNEVLVKDEGSIFIYSLIII